MKLLYLKLFKYLKKTVKVGQLVYCVYLLLFTLFYSLLSFNANKTVKVIKQRSQKNSCSWFLNKE